MRSKRLNRQINKAFPLEGLEESLDALKAYLQTLPEAEQRCQLTTILDSFPGFLNVVDETFTQLEEKAVMAQRNLELSSSELTAANGSLFQLNYMQDAMVNSLGQGFLMFGADSVCLSIHSKACEDLLETNPAGRRLSEVLKIKPARVEMFEEWCKMLFEECFDFEELQGVAPKSFEHTSDRFISLEFKPVFDRENRVQSVVVIATDRTGEMRANQEAKRMHGFATMVTSILKDKNQFRNFVHVSREILKAATMMVGQRDFGRAELDSIKRGLHTLKGTAGSFGVVQVKDLVHQVESKIASQHDLEFVRTCLQGALNEVGTLFENMLTEHAELFQDFLEHAEPTREIPLNDLESFAVRLENSGLKDIQRDFLRDFVAIPVHRVLSRYNTSLLDTARKLNKQVEPIKFEGDNFTVIPEDYDPLLASLVHIFRNIAEHGIEDSSKRTTQAKAASGHVTVSTEKLRVKDRAMIKISISDDGGGVDTERIRLLLRSKGDPRAETLTREQLLMTIFNAGFTTAKKVTEFSGRGVGLDAVKFEVEALGGQVGVVSEMGRGTTFTISIPYDEVRSRLARHVRGAA